MFALQNQKKRRKYRKLLELESFLIQKMSSVDLQTYLTLNSGHRIPQVGLGTWLSKPGEVGNAVDEALKIGYRHFDCAVAYSNEAEVGKIFGEYFSKGKIKRDDIFVTSKVWNTFHSFSKALECIDNSLRDLQLPYLDMCLIHWPMGFQEGGELFPKNEQGKMLYSDVDYLDTWKALEHAVNTGKVKSIGVSNFNQNQLDRLLNNCQIKPSDLQVEAHPYFPQTKLLDWCKKHDIVLTAFSPLANPAHILRKPEMPDLFTNPTLLQISKKHSKTVSQVVLRWAIQRGTAAIPKAVQKDHLEQNFDVWNFVLSEEEMKNVNNLDQSLRITSLVRDIEHPLYPFHNL